MSTVVQFAKATDRQTEAYWVRVFGVALLVSYETIVAAHYYETRIVQKNHWGPTTGRHIKECISVGLYVTIDNQHDFTQAVDKMILEAVVRQWKPSLTVELVDQRMNQPELTY